MSSTPPNDPWVKPVIIGSTLLILVTVGVLASNLFSTIASNSTVGTIKTASAAEEADTNTATDAITQAAADTASKQAKQTAAAESTTETTETTATEAEPAKPTQVADTSINGEKVYKGICFSCHDMGVAGAPKLDDKTAWDERIKAGVDSIYNVALTGKGAMPAKGGNPALSDDEVKAAVDHMLNVAGVSTANAADAPENTASTETASEAASETTEVAAASHASINGEKVYKGICFSCHDMGIAGAPKVGEQAAWTDRIAAGTESMYNIAINGKGAMPAKGGNPALSDDEIKAAVDYMVSTVQ